MDNLTRSYVSTIINFMSFYFGKVCLATIETIFFFAGNSLSWSVDMVVNWGYNILAGRMLCHTYILIILWSFSSWKKVMFVSCVARVGSFHILLPPFHFYTKKIIVVTQCSHKSNLTCLCPQQKKPFFQTSCKISKYQTMPTDAAPQK